MDDIIVIGSDVDHISWVKSILMIKFKMKDLDLLQYFLEIKVNRHNDTLTLSQQKYTLDILCRIKIKNCKPIKHLVS